MEKESDYLIGLLLGLPQYTCLSLNDYLLNYDKVKLGRHGILTQIFGQYDLILDSQTHFELGYSKEGGFILEYYNSLSDNSSPSKIDLREILPDYTLVNPFTKETLEVKLNILELLETTPQIITYPDKKLIKPIFNPVIFFDKSSGEHFVYEWSNERLIKKDSSEVKETPLSNILVPQFF